MKLIEEEEKTIEIFVWRLDGRRAGWEEKREDVEK